MRLECDSRVHARHEPHDVAWTSTCFVSFLLLVSDNFCWKMEVQQCGSDDSRDDSLNSLAVAVQCTANLHCVPIHQPSVLRTLKRICLYRTCASKLNKLPKITFPASYAQCSDQSRTLKYGVWSPNDKKWEVILKRRYTQISRTLNATPLPTKNHRMPLPNKTCSAVVLQSGRSTNSQKNKSKYQIPRIIHHIWIGTQCPAIFQIWMKKWREYHPEWQHILWDESAIEIFGLENASAFAAAPNYGEKSDIARYEILARMGGVYVDADMECQQPLDLLHCIPNCGFYAGVSNTGTIEVNNAIIGCRPGHPIVLECIRRIRLKAAERARHVAQHSQLTKLFRMSASQADGKIDLSTVLQAKLEAQFPTIECTGPGMFSQVVMSIIQCHEAAWEKQSSVQKHSAPSNQMGEPSFIHQKLDGERVHRTNITGEISKNDDVWILPPTFFYPLSNDGRQEPLDKRRAAVRQESFTLHHWACSWMDKTQVSPWLGKT